MAEFISCQLIVQLCIILSVMIDASIFMNISSVIIVMVKNNNTNTSSPSSHGPQYDWTSFERNQLLGCAYMGTMCGEFLSGRLGELYGPRIVHTVNTMVCGILTIFQPFAFSYGFEVAYITRFLLGLAISPGLPSTAVLLVNWFPPSERTRSTAIISTFSLGAAGSFQLFSLLLNYFSWPVIFYVNGALCILSAFLWFYLIYDTPEKHPRINVKEKKRIREKQNEEMNFKTNVTPSGKQKLPVLYIATSVPLLVSILSRLCLGCLHSFVMLQLTTYLNDVLHFSIGQSGFFTSLPFIGHVVWAFVTSYAADKLLSSQVLSKTNIRKLMECSYQIIVAFMMIILAFGDLNGTNTVILFIIGGTVMGSHTAGHFSNIMDLAPNFSGTLIGISSSFNSIGVFLSTLICGLVVTDTTSYEQWQNVFLVMAGVSVSFALLYGFLAKAEVQHWNDLNEYRKKKENAKMLSQLDEIAV